MRNLKIAVFAENGDCIDFAKFTIGDAHKDINQLYISGCRADSAIIRLEGLAFLNIGEEKKDGSK